MNDQLQQAFDMLGLEINLQRCPTVSEGLSPPANAVKAVQYTVGAVAASSNTTMRGLCTSVSAGAKAVCPKQPGATPNTSSPTRLSVTPAGKAF
jgi:hypothetical protein